MSRDMQMARMGNGWASRSPYAYGDPGFSLGGLLKGGLKVIGGAAKGFVTGGPAGALKGAAGAAITAIRGKSAGPGQVVLPPSPFTLPPSPFTNGGGGVTFPGIGGFPGGGGTTTKQLPPGGPGTVITDVGAVIACQTGFHANKSAYYRRSPQGTVIFHPRGTVCVRNRRRNPLNPRALSRSLSRMASAKRAVMRVLAVKVTTGKGKPKMIIRRRKAK